MAKQLDGGTSWAQVGKQWFRMGSPEACTGPIVSVSRRFQTKPSVIALEEHAGETNLVF